MNTPALIPDAVAPRPAAPSAVKPVGRGATPQLIETMQARKPNPLGRSEMTVRFRPLREWQSWAIHTDHRPRITAGSRLADAVDLAFYFFCEVGGFRICDDAIVREFYDALALHNPQKLRWAIDAKAQTLIGRSDRETAAKARFRGGPEAFFARGLDYWLAGSLPYKDHVAREDSRKAKAAAAQRAADPAHRTAQQRAADAAYDAGQQQTRAAQRTKDQAAARRAVRDRCTLELLSNVERAAYEAQAIGAIHQGYRATGQPLQRPPDSELLPKLCDFARARWMQTRDKRLDQVNAAAEDCSAEGAERRGGNAKLSMRGDAPASSTPRLSVSSPAARAEVPR